MGKETEIMEPTVLPDNEVKILRQAIHERDGIIDDLLNKEAEFKNQLNEKDAKINDLTARSLKVFEENRLLTASDRIAEMKAQLDYESLKMKHDLAIADQFAKSKAFPEYNAEQIYVLMKTGEEMGLSSLQSLQMLYIVNGQINPYGDKMIAHVTRNGYQVKYSDESPEGVTVTIFKGNESYTETVIKKDVSEGKAFKFAPKQKMRFHGIRMICSFHLPHLFGSVSDSFTTDFHEWEEAEKSEKKEQKQLVASSLESQIKNCTSLEELETVYEDNREAISKNMNLVTLLGKQKKKYTNE